MVIDLKFGFLPFLIEALGSTEKLYPFIDEIYKKDKLRFHASAKEHVLYNSAFISEGTLQREEYCKKALGIVLNSDKGYDDDISLLLKKGWPYIYTYVENHHSIKLSEFTLKFTKKSKGLDTLTSTEINHIYSVLMTLSMANGNNIDEDDPFYIDLLSFFAQRSEHIDNPSKDIISHNKMTKEELKLIRDLKIKIFGKYGNFSSVDDLHFEDEAMNTFSDSLFVIYDFENTCPYDTSGKSSFSAKEIEELLYIYYLNNNQDVSDIEKAAKFLTVSMHIRALVKAYKDVKNYYFRNNKETLFVELDALEKEKEVALTTLKTKETSNQSLRREIEKKDKEVKRLKEELNKHEYNKKELEALREFMFSLDKNIEYAEEKPDLSDISGVKGLIIGGRDDWQRKVKEVLPGFKTLSTDSLGFDINIVLNSDIVFIYSNCLNHGMYYKVIDRIRYNDIPLCYLPYNKNINITLSMIHSAVKKKLKVSTSK